MQWNVLVGEHFTFSCPRLLAWFSLARASGCLLFAPQHSQLYLGVVYCAADRVGWMASAQDRFQKTRGRSDDSLPAVQSASWLPVSCLTFALGARGHGARRCHDSTKR